MPKSKLYVMIIIKYIYNRLLEASTWRNLILLAGGSWAVKNPDQAELIIPVCVSVAGFMGSLLPDILGKKVEPKTDLETKTSEIETTGWGDK